MSSETDPPVLCTDGGDDEFDSGDGFDLGEWLGYLSYEKIHALGYGFAIFWLAATANSPTVLAGGLAIALWALGIRASPHRSTKTGDKDRPSADEGGDEDEIEARSSDGQGSGLHAQILAEIRHKPHYFFAAGFVGDRVGYLTHYWLYSVPPDHYEHIPRLVRLLVAGV